MKPFSITIDGKTTEFKDANALWNWCIQNKPNWIQFPNTSCNINWDYIQTAQNSDCFEQSENQEMCKNCCNI